MKNKSLGTNALLNTIRQSLSILFPLITFPYVSRVLGTDEFGKYTFSASIVTYFQLLATFGISTFAIREGAAIRDDKEKISYLASELFSFNTVTCLIAYVALAVLVAFNSKANAYAMLIFIQSMCMVLTLFGLDWVNNVYEDFLYITIRYIIIQIIALISIFVFVKSSADTAKYCLILVLGSYGGNLINLLYIRKYISFPRLLIFPVKKYIVPLSILFVNSLATTIYVNSDVTMIGFFMDDNAVGLYSFASKIYNILKYFINAAIVVTVPRLALLVNRNKDKYGELIEKILYVLIIFLLPIATGLFMLSKPIIMIAGGNEYIEGASSLMVLSFSLVFALLGSICTNCILVINKLEKRVLTATITSAIINVFLNIFLIPVIGIIGAAITTVIAEMLNLVIQYHYCYKDLSVSIAFRTKDVACAIFGAFEVIIICGFVSKIWVAENLANSMKIVGLAMVLSGIAFFLTLAIANNSLITSMIQRGAKRSE